MSCPCRSYWGGPQAVSAWVSKRDVDHIRGQRDKELPARPEKRGTGNQDVSAQGEQRLPPVVPQWDPRRLSRLISLPLSPTLRDPATAVALLQKITPSGHLRFSASADIAAYFSLLIAKKQYVVLWNSCKANASLEVTADSGFRLACTSPKGGLRRCAGGRAGRTASGRAHQSSLSPKLCPSPHPASPPHGCPCCPRASTLACHSNGGAKLVPGHKGIQPPLHLPAPTPRSVWLWETGFPNSLCWFLCWFSSREVYLDTVAAGRQGCS